jgi:type I restriction enzyme S subunit
VDDIQVHANSWVTLPLGLLIGEIEQGWSPKCDTNQPVGPSDWAIVKTTAVQHRRYSDTELKRLPDNLSPRPNIEIKAGDFLMTRKGPRVRTGVACLVRKTRQRIMLCDTVYRFRCDETTILPSLLEYSLNSPYVLR